MPVGSWRLDGKGGRRRVAVARAVRTLRLLRRLGVTAGVVGSLADGRFSEHSDVDFMVLQCPRPLKYAIEGRVEDVMRDIAFDVIYREEASKGVARYSGRGVLDVAALIKSAA